MTDLLTDLLTDLSCLKSVPDRIFPIYNPKGWLLRLLFNLHLAAPGEAAAAAAGGGAGDLDLIRGAPGDSDRAARARNPPPPAAADLAKSFSLPCCLLVSSVMRLGLEGKEAPFNISAAVGRLKREPVPKPAPPASAAASSSALRFATISIGSIGAGNAARERAAARRRMRG